MTFVIREHLEKNGVNFDDHIFDASPYNYIFNKRTAFLDGEFVRNDHKELSWVLRNMYTNRPGSLEALNYF